MRVFLQEGLAHLADHVAHGVFLHVLFARTTPGGKKEALFRPSPDVASSILDAMLLRLLQKSKDAGNQGLPACRMALEFLDVDALQLQVHVLAPDHEAL